MHLKSKNRLIILVVFLLFAVPVVVAYLLGSGMIDFEPDSMKNHGVFISPPVKPADYTDAEWVNDLPEHWTLIYRTPKVCDEACFEWEDKLHRFNLTLAQNADKLELMLLAKDFDLRHQALLMEDVYHTAIEDYRGGYRVPVETEASPSRWAEFLSYFRTKD